MKQTNVYEKVNIEHDHAEKYDYERKLDNQEDYDNELEEVDDDDVDVSKLIEDNLQKMKKKVGLNYDNIYDKKNMFN